MLYGVIGAGLRSELHLHQTVDVQAKINQAKNHHEK